MRETTKAKEYEDGHGLAKISISQTESEKEVLTAPTRAEVLAQQDRTDNAQALDDRAQIDAEASRQTLTRQTAPEQRKDTSGDMFGEEKSVLESAKREADAAAKNEAAKDPNQGSMFDGPADVAPPATTPISKAQTTAPNAKPATESKPTKIEDSGQVLEGARKLYAKNYAAKLAEGMGMDTAAVPLSKSWPEPDYQRLLDEGADPWAVAMARAMREEVPTKPSSWKLKGWVQKVESLRAMTTDVMSGAMSKEKFKATGGQFNLADWFNKIDLYEAMGHEKSLKTLKFSMGEYGMYGGQTFSPAKTLWTINMPGASNAASWSNGNWGNDLVVADTKEQAIEKFKAWSAAQVEKAPTEAKATSFDVYSYWSMPGIIIVGKRIGASKSVDLKEFATSKEARAYIADNQAELERLLAAAKFEPAERGESNAPRAGDDHRGGADVTSEQFREAFGFRGEQFGASMPQGERQANMNQAYDALMDLAGVVGIEPKALSLNSELGLAFGARGHGGKNPAAAHYERDTTGAVTPNRVVINLTRKNGAGSLAHEWFHAVDNYFARMRGEKAGMLTESYANKGDGVRPEMVEAFKRVMMAIQSSGVRERSKRLDKKRVKDYWSTGLEMAARSFESYVIAKLQDKNGSNDYLANIVPEALYTMQGSYPYPVMGEMPAIRAAFDNFFNVVQTKETEQGVAMFSRSAAEVMVDIDESTGQAVEKWQVSLRNAATNPQAKDPSMAMPAVLRVMGAKSAKLVLPRAYLKAIMAKHRDVPANVFENLPSMLADPIFIIPHKDGGLRVFVEAKTASGEPIAVGVSVDEGGRIHTVTPINDQDDLSGQERMMNMAVGASGRIYARNGEAPRNVGASSVAAPGTIPLHRDSSRRRNVITRADVVKQIEAERNKNGAKYSRSATPARGLPTAQVTSIIDAIRARWGNAPEIIVRPTWLTW